ncbi:MAG TPA: 5'-nucleotidase C-terminal domain-containing protein [Thermotogota bacterium]|nr:5'-nucleotidase C-terminal domain-containing protein [Thermotogota bacterium]NLZ13821.1 bifunctional metallophosphatase/5'-nucleotidase [Thermotogaceae bacterium]MDD8040779.1 5'-nucleotidase C-terminal domain-containing protein [Thermotogota bacterium]HNR63296.1 5'-nucleotidase C-terminal domain-containing protein [Thermotogota bacterium]HNT95508.1 5'-nucleotidase C-terminal domain-containing protein [Thermotogota bacterium]
MKKTLLLLTVLLVAALGFSEVVTITILQTSDIHGNIFPINYATNKPSDVGLAKIQTLVKQLKNQDPDLILIDNGDLIQGTPFAYYHVKKDPTAPNPMIQALNLMGFHASVIGNHEFNYGMGILNKASSEADFPLLSANVVRRFSKTPYFEPYRIITVKGVRIGILGLTTKYIPNWEDVRNILDVDFLDPVETAKVYVPHLREKEKVDVVIVSYHGGFERDILTGKPTEELSGENQGYQLLEEVEGIDLLLTGHQHRSIAGFCQGVPVLQPSNWGQMVGKAEIKLDNTEKRWVIVSKSVELISTKGVPADEEVLALVRTVEESTQKWLDTPIGIAKGDFSVVDPLITRMGDNALLEFINKVQMMVSGAKISSTALFTNDIKGWGSGPVSLRDVNAVYIYANTLKVIRVSGQDIKSALERCASYFTIQDGKIAVNESWVSPKPQHYNYDVWEGIDYTIDVSKPIGERVVQLEFEGKPLQMDGEYEVVLNNYRAGGGGNYPMFQGKPVVKDIMMEVAELLSDYILTMGEIEATVDSNWKVIQ